MSIMSNVPGAHAGRIPQTTHTARVPQTLYVVCQQYLSSIRVYVWCMCERVYVCVRARAFIYVCVCILIYIHIDRARARERDVPSRGAVDAARSENIPLQLIEACNVLATVCVEDHN